MFLTLNWKNKDIFYNLTRNFESKIGLSVQAAEKLLIV